MALLLVVAGLGLLCLPSATRRAGRRLAPDHWARLCVYAIASGAAVVELAVTLYALPTALRAAGVPVLADMCERMLRPFLPGGATAEWVAVVVAVAMPALGAVAVIRARRTHRIAHAESWLGEHRRAGRYDVVVLPSDQLLALSVDATVPQVIVSRRLLETLSARKVELVLRHEAAHLDHHHQRLLLMATAADHALFFFPPVRASTMALRIALERWADEEAAGEAGGDREELAAALLDMTSAVNIADLAAFSVAETVVERLQALRRPPARATAVDHVLVCLPGLIVSGGLVVALGGWAEQARAVLAMSGRCPV